MNIRLSLIGVGVVMPVLCLAAGVATPAVYPAQIGAKYVKESAGKARMHTCLDQYNANKTSNANGGLTWIAKGGGYYSVCTKRLGGG